MASDIANLAWSDDAARVAFALESTGVQHADVTRNGYVVGKSWANVQIDEWRDGIAKGLFLPHEFLEDQTLPAWWVREVLGSLCPAE